MKFITIAMAGMLVAATNAATNFKNTCSIVNTQMSSLSQYISQVKAIAETNGHAAISAKCDEASQHLSAARSSWNAVSYNYGSFPWEARSSSHASRCQSRLSSCGSAISWINSRPEISRFPAYRAPISNCRGGHRSCETTCGQVWNWPSPPGYNPRPSGYFRRERREVASKSLCPNHETACPIAANVSGHECINTQTEIYSCGGCVTKNKGENCYAIEGADEFGCEAGVCRVFTALPGWEMSPKTGRPVLSKSS
uniref:Protein CPL1-like domain-containing protein n=1 Tax=Phakopsora pachyrhizi TaxID=170000 RepID=A0A0S1MIM9_PHAPC